MVRVIETNLSMNEDLILDHQSRVIEVESWDEYVGEIKYSKIVERKAYIGNMHGATLPSRHSSIEGIQYDDFHLSCTVYIGNLKTKKLAYLVD